MKVRDAQGTDIRTVEFKNLKKGANALNWNGMNDEGSAAPVGEYNVSLEAEGSNGRKIQVETKTQGLISGVNFTATGPQLMVGKQVVAMSDIKSISDPQVGQPTLQDMLMSAMMPQPAPGTPGATPQGPAVSGHPIDISDMPQNSQGQNKMMPPSAMATPPQGAAPAKTHMMPFKPEQKANAAKVAHMPKGNLNDFAMAQGLINTLNKEGAKTGLEGESGNTEKGQGS
jgi:hypothetical protein